MNVQTEYRLLGIFSQQNILNTKWSEIKWSEKFLRRWPYTLWNRGTWYTLFWWAECIKKLRWHHITSDQISLSWTETWFTLIWSHSQLMKHPNRYYEEHNAYIIILKNLLTCSNLSIYNLVQYGEIQHTCWSWYISLFLCLFLFLFLFLSPRHCRLLWCDSV